MILLSLPSTIFNEPSVDLLSIYEDSIFFFFDQYISKKIVVKNNISLNYQAGFESFKSPIIKPDSIVITGPDELLSKLKYLETDSISFEDINKDVISNINILPNDFFNAAFPLINKTIEKLNDKILLETLRMTIIEI